MTKFIVLCTMIKNEEKVILRMLNSAKNVISGIALTDTGSDDCSCELATNWAQENEIPIEVFHNDWVNFGVSRTQSVANAREFFPNADYFLLLDGDMILRPQEDYDSDKLVLTDYTIEQCNHGTDYYNTRLVGGKHFYRSIGGTHEYWGCPTRVTSSKSDMLKIDDMNDGGSRSDKFARDKRIMLEGLRKGVTPDYLVGRYYFYLGQTYQGAGDYCLSNFWYKRCTEHGGWDQQIYYSLYKIGENYLRMEKFNKAIFYSLKAWNFRPSRAEPLLVLSRALKCSDMKHATKYFCEVGKGMPRSKDVLFIDTGAYDGTKFDEILKGL